MYNFLHTCSYNMTCIKKKDEDHAANYIHTCTYGSACCDYRPRHKIMNNHTNCKAWDKCLHTNPTHYIKYRHPPVCMLPVCDREKQSLQHYKDYIHIDHIFLRCCPYDNNCNKRFMLSHYTVFTHNYARLKCRNGPRCELLKYSNYLKDSQEYRLYSIHVATHKHDFPKPTPHTVHSNPNPHQYPERLNYY
jgi:hypothetical protein